MIVPTTNAEENTMVVLTAVLALWWGLFGGVASTTKVEHRATKWFVVVMCLLTTCVLVKYGMSL